MHRIQFMAIITVSYCNILLINTHLNSLHYVEVENKSKSARHVHFIYLFYLKAVKRCMAGEDLDLNW